MLDSATTQAALAEELAVLKRRLAQLEAANTAPPLPEAKSMSMGSRLDRFFDSSLVASLLFDAEGVLIAVNPAAARLLGVPRASDILGSNLFESPNWTEEQRRQLSNGEVLRLRAPLDFEEVRASGKWQPLRSGVSWLDWSVSSLGPDGYFMQMHDVTREVETERALESKERLFEEMFEAIPFPTIVWRHVGMDKFVLDRFNTAAGDLGQGRLLEFVGVDMDEFHENVPEFPARVREAFYTGAKQTVETTYTLRTTGEQRHLITTAVKVGDDYVLDSGDDLTALKQVQMDLEETRDALQRSLQEKELLLQEIHHRVKNNLAIVSSLLEMQVQTADDERLRKMLRESQNRILSVARAHEVLYQSDDLRYVDLGRYVEILTKQLHGAFGAEGVVLRYDAASIKLPVNRAVHFGLILNELISNAFKHAFGPDQQDPAIDVSLKRVNGHVELIVHDNGRGLPESFSLDQAGTLGVQVIGLLAEQLDGDVRCESAPGKGCAFFVRVPYQSS